MNFDSYYVDLTCSGTFYTYSYDYNSSYWVSASSPYASARTNLLLMDMRVTNQDLSVSISSDQKNIIMEGTYRVGIFASINGWGNVEIGHQVVNGIWSWNVNNYAY